jgi:hypothetical protein
MATHEKTEANEAQQFQHHTVLTPAETCSETEKRFKKETAF